MARSRSSSRPLAGSSKSRAVSKSRTVSPSPAPAGGQIADHELINADLKQLASVAQSAHTLIRQNSGVFDSVKQGSVVSQGVRLVAFLIDAIVMWFFSIGLKFIFRAYHLCEPDFFPYFIKTLSVNERGTVMMMSVKLAGDVSESSLLLAIVSVQILLVFFVSYMVNSGQTFGMAVTGLSFTAAGGGAQLPTGFAGTVIACLVNAITFPGCVYASFDDSGRTIGDILVGVSVVSTRKLRSPRNEFFAATPVKESSRSGSSSYGIAAEVNKPYHERCWNDLGFLLFFVLSTAGFYFSQKLLFANDVVKGGAYEGWFKWIISTMFGGVDLFITKYPAASVLMMAATVVVFSAILLILRFLAVAVLNLSILVLLGREAFWVYEMIMANNQGQIACSVIALAATLIFVWRVYARLKLTIEVWREAICAVTSHPALGLSVPMIELGFQVYQCWLLSRWLAMYPLSLWRPEALWLHRWASFQQYMVLFTLRAAFEIAVSGTVAKYYFRGKDEDGFLSGLQRVGMSLVTAFTKSFGSAVFAGGMLYLVDCVQRAHEAVAKSYSQVTWVFFPVKLLLLILKMALAVIYSWLQNFVLFCCAYVGAFGCTLTEAAGKTATLMRSDFGGAMIAGNWSTTMMTLIGNLSLSILWVLTPRMQQMCAKMLANPEVAHEKYRVPSFVIGAYLILSMLWSLSGATRTVYLCLMEERRRGETSRAPPQLCDALKSVYKGY